MYGVRGSPERSNERFVNKIFDFKRRNAKEAMTTNGCDIEYGVRDTVMAVGKVPRGGNRGLDERVA
jgi:hypothetical protein